MYSGGDLQDIQAIEQSILQKFEAGHCIYTIVPFVLSEECIEDHINWISDSLSV